MAWQPFVDGNKRTCAAADVYLLSALGHRVAAEKGGLEESAVSVAMRALTLEKIAGWFEARSREG